MIVYIVPVSGGAFVIQLSLLQHLSEISLKPDLVLASSGGNLASYIGSAANWHWASIERISRTINTQMFIIPWNNASFLSSIIGYFRGNIYNKGSGSYTFMNNNFTSQSIQKYEIWTGTYNNTRQKTRIFCNTSIDKSILNLEDFEFNLTQTLPPIYANGNIDLIAQVGVASASIPALVPAQIIDSEEYIDGGVSCASPLTVMQHPILAHVNRHQKPLHLFYINNTNLNGLYGGKCHNVMDTWTQAVHNVIKSQIIVDRYCAYDIIKSLNGHVHNTSFSCNHHNLKNLLELQEHSKYTFTELYPNENIEIDITNFTGDDVVNAIHNVYDKCHCRLWWTGNHNHTIDNILNKFI